MQIVENLGAWSDYFEANWLAHFLGTGERDFGRYKPIRNQVMGGTAGVDLAHSRLMFVSSAGGYLRDGQTPFNIEDHTGDYTHRIFPTATPFDQLGFIHHSYDTADVYDDPQVLLPLRHLEAMVTEGQIGELAPSVISFMGYQPDVARVAHELIPPIVAMAKAEEVQAVLLVPS